MTAEERENVVGALGHSHEALKRSVCDLTEEQFRAKPESGGWSLAEIVEHLTILEARFPSTILPLCLRNERVEEIDYSKDSLAEGVRARNQKIQGPPSVTPQGTGLNPQQALLKFAELRGQIVDYVQTTKDELRHHRAAHPIFGPLDGYQWLLILAAHTERHVKQIEEAKAGL